jgi:polyisoprenoid-binding protein YceI
MTKGTARKWLIAVALVAVLSGTAVAAPKTNILELDPAKTSIQFTLGDILHTVHGTFQLTRGSIEFDPDTGNATGAVIVNAASGNSGSGARDSRMHKNVLESSRYPEAVFKPDHVAGKVLPVGVSHVQVHGIFTLHGSGHEMTLPVDIENSPGGMVARTHFAVPYVQWGLKNPSTLFLRVNPTVDIDIQASGKVLPGK